MNGRIRPPFRPTRKAVPVSEPDGLSGLLVLGRRVFTSVAHDARISCCRAPHPHARFRGDGMISDIAPPDEAFEIECRGCGIVRADPGYRFFFSPDGWEDRGFATNAREMIPTQW